MSAQVPPELMRSLQFAISRLRAQLIASSSLLDRPFTDAPDQSPWSRTSAALLRVMAAADALDVALIPRADPGSERKEPVR